MLNFVERKEIATVLKVKVCPTILDTSCNITYMHPYHVHTHIYVTYAAYSQHND
jgi:hypothetical protein